MLDEDGPRPDPRGTLEFTTLFTMASPTLKQQKTFALVRIIGGFAAAGVLGYSFVANVLAGQPAEGAVLGTGIMALLALGYAAFYTRNLSRIAEQEKSAGTP